MLHAAMFDQRLLDKTCTVIFVTLLYGCQISVLSALSLDFIKYKLKRSNADSFHHHLAYLPNRKLYPNIRCRCGLDTVRMSFNIREKETSYCWVRSPYRHKTSRMTISSVPRGIPVWVAYWKVAWPSEQNIHMRSQPGRKGSFWDKDITTLPTLKLPIDEQEHSHNISQ